MDALWNLEDELKISTSTAATLLVCSVVLVIGVCVAIFRVGQKGRNRVVAEVLKTEDEDDGNAYESGSESSCDRARLLVKDVLSESVRWSEARRWKENDPEVVVERWRWWWRKTAGRWRRESRRPPVWQRPILMGEKCELPRFSGLILYDENGHPLDQ